VEGSPYDNVTVALFPADPLPPAPPRSGLAAMWRNYGTLFLIGGFVGLAALAAGLAMWMRQRHSKQASGNNSPPAVATGSRDEIAHRPSLRVVGLDTAQSSD
jgi:hypothetical protein